jgi:hypothetical protein
MPALLLLALQYLPQLAQAAGSIPKLIDYIRGIRDIAKQNGELTQEQEAQFDKHLDELDAKFKSHL